MKSFFQHRPVASAALTIALAAVAVYANSLRGVFLFDDAGAIIENSTLRHLWPLGPVWTQATYATVVGRPFLNFSFALNYAMGGLNPVGYHVVNVLIHSLAGLTLLGVLRHTFQRAGLRAPLGLAWVAALIWTVHPLQTESVSYVCQRAESLAGLFYLLVFYCVVRGEAAHSRRWYALAVLACLLGVGTKETLVTAPVLVWIYDRLFLAGTFREAWRRRWGLYVGLVATWGWIAVVAFLPGKLAAGIGEGAPFTMGEYARSQPGVILHYLRLAIWPHPLVFNYGWPVAQTARDMIPGMIGIGALVAGSLWALWRRPGLGFLGVWFFGVLSPTSSVVPILDLAFEHRMYLPLASVVTLGVVTGHWLLKRYSVFACVMAATVVVALGTRTVMRNREYLSPTALWEGVARERPDTIRWRLNLGAVLFEQGKKDEALDLFQQAVSLRPENPDAHYSLASALSHRDQYAEALSHYDCAIQFLPNMAKAHYGRGAMLVRLGRLPEAATALATAVRCQPDFSQARYVWGWVLYQQGQVDLAAEQFAQTLLLDPRHAAAHNNLGTILMSRGQPAEALAHYERALQSEPDLAMAHYGRGTSLLQLGRTQEAIASLETAIRLQPNHSQAHNNLGALRLQQGRREEAVEHFRRALAADPNNADARANLERALAPPFANP